MGKLIYLYLLNLQRKIKEKQTVKLHMRKMSKTIGENELTVTVKTDFYPNLSYIRNLYAKTKIMIRRNHIYPFSPSTTVTVFLIVEKLLIL